MGSPSRCLYTYKCFPGVKLPLSIHNPVSGMVVLEHMERHSDGHKMYCQRALVQHTDCLNTNSLDCSVTFMVDKNICLLGVQVNST